MSDPIVKPTVDLGAPDVVGATCEFCKLKYWILPSQGAVAHELPYCAEFQGLDALDYLRSNRKIKEGKVVQA